MIKRGVETTAVPGRAIDLPLQLGHVPRSTVSKAHDVGQVTDFVLDRPYFGMYGGRGTTKNLQDPGHPTTVWATCVE